MPPSVTGSFEDIRASSDDGNKVVLVKSVDEDGWDGAGRRCFESSDEIRRDT